MWYHSDHTQDSEEFKLIDHDPVFSLGEVFKAVFVGIASVAIWLLKKLGDQHITSINALNTKMDHLIEKLEVLSNRVTVVEVRMKHMEDDTKKE